MRTHTFAQMIGEAGHGTVMQLACQHTSALSTVTAVAIRYCCVLVIIHITSNAGLQCMHCFCLCMCGLIAGHVLCARSCSEYGCTLGLPLLDYHKASTHNAHKGLQGLSSNWHGVTG